MTLPCEDANSILVEVVTVDAEKPVDNSLVQIWKLKFCRKDNFFVQTLSTRFVQDLKLKFRRYFENEVKSVFWC